MGVVTLLALLVCHNGVSSFTPASPIALSRGLSSTPTTALEAINSNNKNNNNESGENHVENQQQQQRKLGAGGVCAAATAAFLMANVAMTPPPAYAADAAVVDLSTVGSSTQVLAARSGGRMGGRAMGGGYRGGYGGGRGYSSYSSRTIVRPMYSA